MNRLLEFKCCIHIIILLSNPWSVSRHIIDSSMMDSEKNRKMNGGNVLKLIL